MKNIETIKNTPITHYINNPIDLLYHCGKVPGSSSESISPSGRSELLTYWLDNYSSETVMEMIKADANVWTQMGCTVFDQDDILAVFPDYF